MSVNLPKREIKKIISGEDARKLLLSGARQIADAVGSTYGPAGNDVILGMPYGDAVLTRDGVTVAKRILLEDTIEDKAAQIFRQASEKTNKTAGDGTTATIVLGVNLYEAGLRSVAIAKSPTQEGMRLRNQLVEDSRKVIKYLNEQSIPGEGKLLEVATVSAGDPGIGKLISDTLKDVGTEGGITIREQDYPTLDVERVQGYYFDRGFFALQGEVKYTTPLIFVSQKPIESNADMVPILNRIVNGTNKNLVIIGEVRMNSDAINTLLLNVMQKKLNAVVVPPPAFGDESKLFMEDIAMYVNAKLYVSGDDPSLIDDSYFGSAETAQVGPNRAIILKGGGDADEISTRAADIKGLIKKETSSHRKDQLEQRYAKLTGKIAIVNVGGSTPAEMEELRYRVEDAIEATKSAMADGVLPGGATALVHAAELDISPIFKEALYDTFRKLMTNAAESADHRLEQVRESGFGFGFNLRKMTPKPIDLRKAGVWDATRAVIQTIENGTSAAGSLLKTSTIIDPIERNDESES
jgi:chaperonin GroEL